MGFMPNRVALLLLLGWPAAAAANDSADNAGAPRVTVGGYVETFAQWNANDPSNRITAARGYDNRAGAFALSNAVMHATAVNGPVGARIALQVGQTGETIYLAEPSAPGGGGAPATDGRAWKHLQEANVSYAAGDRLRIDAGLFLSPIGPEGPVILDQWSWSRSNLFFALPAYHAGARLTGKTAGGTEVSLLVGHGWNDVVDNNDAKSLAIRAAGGTAGGGLTGAVLYAGGVERADGAPEGEPWRHLFDAYATWALHPHVSVLVHADAGFEETAFGRSHWAAGATSVRVRLRPTLHLAARTDLFREHAAEDADGRAAPIFWPVSRVASQTLTCELRPRDDASFRLEYRHDAANAPLYFEGSVPVDASGAAVPNAETQDTLTAGMAVRF